MDAFLKDCVALAKEYDRLYKSENGLCSVNAFLSSAQSPYVHLQAGQFTKKFKEYNTAVGACGGTDVYWVYLDGVYFFALAPDYKETDHDETGTD